MVTFSGQQAGNATCESPSMVLTLHQDGTALSGSYGADGLGICIAGSSILVGDMAFGAIASGTAENGNVTLVIRTALQFTGAFDGDSMGGSLSWMVGFPGQGVVEMTGNWSAIRLPATSPDGVPYRMIFTETANAVPQASSLAFPVVTRDRGGNLVNNPALTFSSSNPAVATVSNAGVVTTGTALNLFRIRAQSGFARAEGVGVVIQRPGSFVIAPFPLILNRFRQVQIVAQALDLTGAVIPGAPLTYVVGDITIAQVSASGLLSSQGVSGQTTITIAWAGVDTVVPVNVIALPARVALSPLAVSLVPGDTQSFIATVFDSSDIPIANAPVTWGSSDASIASVSPAGLVTAELGGGLATITATAASGDTAQARVLNWTTTLPSVTATTRIGGKPVGLDISTSGAIYVGDNVGGGLWRGDLPAVDFPVNLPFGGSFPAVAFNPSGTRVYAQTSGAGNLLVINVATDAVIDSITRGDGLAVFVSPDGATLFAGHFNALHSYDAATLAPIDSATFGMVHFLAHHPSQPLLYASTDAGVFELDAGTLIPIRTFGVVPGAYRQLVVSPDGATLFVGLEGTGVYAYDLGTGQQSGFAPHGGFGVAYSPGRDLIYTTGLGSLTALDRGSLIPVFSADLVGVARRIAMAPDGLTAVILDDEGDVNFVQ